MKVLNGVRLKRAALLACGAILLGAASPGDARAQAPVTVSEQEVVIPTYLAGDPEPNPMFFFGRESQGAEGRVYPYPLYDTLTHRKADKAYRLIYLENEYVRIGILPEIGGRVFEGFDKTNNYHFFYRQHVIKPALIGLIGAWISGGIEWNIPHHHRATTFLPVQYRIEEDPDGSKTVWVGELEIRHRMRWAVGYTLRPGRSYLEAQVRVVNRTPVVNTMLAFANVAVHVNDQYQVVFPPRTQLGTHHHKRQFTRWPIADSRYGSADFSGGVDISWYKNHTAANSVFAWNSEEDFVAGYDHGRRAGTMAIADHQVVPGKKFWTWGTGPRGRMWDAVLTDDDGPYMEIMVGGYSDNQPDYSWLQPYETKSFEIYWYPFREIGGAKQANVDAAVNLDVRNGVATVGFYATSAHAKAVARLSAGDRVLFEQTIAIDPARPFVRDVRLPEGVAEHELRASLTADNRQLVSYQPVRQEPAQMPAPVGSPQPPSKIASVEELYLTGLWIEQFHNASLEPDPYWEEALRRDPANTRVNTAVGINRFKKARYADAERHLRAALARLDDRYAMPKDAEAAYYLGLTLQAQRRYDEAHAFLYKSTWDMAWRAPGYYALAEIASLHGDFTGALAHLDRALDANGSNLRAWNLKAAVLRHLGRKDDALAALTGAHRVDSLDAQSMAERWLMTRRDDDASRLRETLTAHRALAEELAAEYMKAGMWQDGRDVLGLAPPSAMVLYYLGDFSERLGGRDDAAGYRRRAAQASPAYGFPFQWEAEPVLRGAVAANPEDARAWYYLGNLLYDWQPEQAIAAWERSAAIDPGFPIAHRNLAVAHAHSGKPEGRERAIASLEKAVSLPGPRYAMHFAELDRLYEEAGKPPEQRLKLLEANHDVVVTRDEALARAISLKVFAGKLDDAIRLLSSRRFSVWEGGTLNVRDPWTNAHILRGHERLAARRYREAIAAYENALTFPENLTSERLDASGRRAEVEYWTGVAKQAMGDEAGARRAWEAAASVAPTRRGAADSGDQQYFEALALRKLGREQTARERLTALGDMATRLLEQASSDAGREARARYLAGLAHMGLGRLEEGRRELQKALQTRPDFLPAKMALGHTQG
jgi:tetratricopeptide (TPR) repeat protein